MSLLLLFNQPASVTTYLSDTFTGSNGSSWNSSNWTMQGGTQTIQGNRGAMLTPGGYGNSIIDVVPTIPANFSFAGQVQFASANSTFAIEYRNNGTDYYRAFVTPTELVIYSTPWATIVAFASISTSLTDLVNFRLEVDGTSHKMRFWLNSDPEPSTWNINATNSVTTATPTVPMRLFYGDPNAVTGYLDNVSITSVGGAAGSVAATLSGSSSASAGAAFLVEKVVSAAGSSESVGTATLVASTAGSVTFTATGTSASTGAATVVPDHPAAFAGSSASTGAATVVPDHAAAFAGSSASTGAATVVADHPAAFTGSSASTGAATFTPTTAGSVTFTATGTSTSTGTIAAGIGQGLAASGSSATSATSSFVVEHVAVATGQSASAGSATAGVAHAAVLVGSINAPADASAIVTRAAMLAGASLTAGSATFFMVLSWPVRRYDPATQSWVVCSLREWNGSAWVVSDRVKMWDESESSWVRIGT